MTTRLITRLMCIVLIGAALGGCTRCGWLWEEGSATPKACRSDTPVR